MALSPSPARAGVPWIDTTRKGGNGDFYLAASGDLQLATSGDFRLAIHSEAHRRQLLQRASKSLAPRAHLNRDSGYERSAVLHGCQLAQVYLMLGDLDGVVAAARVATALLPEVQSGRCAAKLRGLHKALSQRCRSPVIAEFLPELQHALGVLR